MGCHSRTQFQNIMYSHFQIARKCRCSSCWGSWTGGTKMSLKLNSRERPKSTGCLGEEENHIKLGQSQTQKKCEYTNTNTNLHTATKTELNNKFVCLLIYLIRKKCGCFIHIKKTSTSPNFIF